MDGREEGRRKCIERKGESGWLRTKEEVRTAVEGKEQADGFDGGRRRERIESIKGKGEGRYLETGSEDRNK